MNGAEFVAELNALAERIPPKAFSITDTALDCVAYAIVFRGAAPVEYERDKRVWTVQNGTVVYVGEGKRGRATAQFKARGKVVGYVGKEFDHFIAAHWPNFEIYLAAANITKPVALEFERILIETFAPPFNEAPPRSSWWAARKATSTTEPTCTRPDCCPSTSRKGCRDTRINQDGMTEKSA